MRNYRASLPAFCLVFLGRYLNDNVNGHCCGLVVWILHTLRKYTGMQRRRYILFPQKLKETFVPLHSVGSMADLKMRFCGFFFFSISSSIRNVPYFLISTKQLLCLLAKKKFHFLMNNYTLFFNHFSCPLKAIHPNKNLNHKIRAYTFISICFK